jgi:dTDP-L-rhamnose 4-epimerase
MTTLITGGAGFIGSRLGAALARRGGRVVAFDNLLAQVHGAAPDLSMLAGVELLRGDVRDPVALVDVLRRAAPRVVVHLAAETGTGQSRDEVVRYCDVNITGTARLIEAIRASGAPVRRVVLASSRAVYGEGPYRTDAGAIVVPPARSAADLSAGRFEPRLSSVPGPLMPAVSDEATPPCPCSVYASTKLAQEHLLTQTSDESGWTPVVLRLQNVYGPGQSVRNPYTGVLSIFVSQALAGRNLAVFEDGAIVRDFVFIDDVVRALELACALERPPAGPINIGSGQRVTVLDVARLVLRAAGRSPDDLQVTGAFRLGDTRHAVASIERAGLLGWRPEVRLEQGIAELVTWARAQPAQGTARRS